MKVKYNRVSTIHQTGNRFSTDENYYDLVLFDKVSGKVPFKERPKAQQLVELVELGKVKELVIEEFSRVGRTIGDCIQTLEWLETYKVNVIVRNLGIQSRPNGKKNPIWGLLSATMASLYSMELENIRERTATGRLGYVANGGRLGRSVGSTESEKQFLEKPKSKEIIKWLNKGRTVREIASHTNSSAKTIIKTKKISMKYGVLVEA
ncbi:MAG: recombinase family protein [Ignavibacteriales bacterium]|nr:recombinase family protein [Ignavibacteriales bacterium]